jgi:hypothetical protein
LLIVPKNGTAVQDFINQSSFTVVNVRDDRNISDFLHENAPINLAQRYT